MRQAIEIVGVLNLVLFAAIAGVCVRQWLRDRSRTSMWAALAFVSLAAVAGSGYVLPDEPGSTAEKVALRVAIVLLVLFPYLALPLRLGVRAGAAAAGALRRLAHAASSWSRRSRCRTCRPEGDSWPWWFVRLRARLPRPLVGAAAARRDPALARGQVGGDRRPAADADARARVDRAGRDAARERRSGRRPLVVRAHRRRSWGRSAPSASCSASRRRRCCACSGAGPSRRACSSRSAS